MLPTLLYFVAVLRRISLFFRNPLFLGFTLLLTSLLCFTGCATNTASLSYEFADYEAAREQFRTQNYAQAAELFSEFIEAYPESNRLHTAGYYLGESKRKAGRNARQALTPEEMRTQTAKRMTDKLAQVTESATTTKLGQTAGTLEKDGEEQGLISNVFFETDLRQALEDIAAQANIPIIADETVQGSVTMDVVDMPLEQVLDMILIAGGYTYKKMNGYYLVGIADPLNPIFSLLSDTEFIKPTYIKAQDIETYLPDQLKQYVQVNVDQNALTITASAATIRQIKNIIAKVDKEPQQIMLQSVVLDLTSTGRETLGIDWNWSWNTAYDSSEGSESSGTIGLGYDPYTDSFGQGLENGFGFAFAGTGQLTASAMASIKALVEDGQGFIRATPRVVTLDGQEASININMEEYVSITTGPVTYPYTELEVIKYGITLKIVPFISEQGDIIVNILPAEVSDVVAQGDDNLPIISRRTVSTTVRVKDGETIIIGGLIRKYMEETEQKVPVLGDIPVLGWLFKKSHTESLDAEIMVLITPRILETAQVSKQRSA